MGIFKVVLVLMVLVVVVGIALIEGVANVGSIPIKSYPGSVVPPAMFVNNIDIYFFFKLYCVSFVFFLLYRYLYIYALFYILW